ncbi:hypothetical protein RFI_01785 [Reticulomyxa filosa]|uniref:Uncharacterized protein n=1 Tax=Reticulomyxa filosa TaxID=46433 RepID=X6PAV5_RETFI|nr:hypothetical protein RFI_01785 [Reticulomyxa filosa]|eukprot:ETO35281.1 hypothetical protein RFI_01785 [Reticulomyxa filosa]
MKQHLIGTRISKAQLYETLNGQWIDIHVKDISSKLSELRIQGNQIATESNYMKIFAVKRKLNIWESDSIVKYVLRRVGDNNINLYINHVKNIMMYKKLYLIFFHEIRYSYCRLSTISTTI